MKKKKINFREFISGFGKKMKKRKIFKKSGYIISKKKRKKKKGYFKELVLGYEEKRVKSLSHVLERKGRKRKVMKELVI